MKFSVANSSKVQALVTMLAELYREQLKQDCKIATGALYNFKTLMEVHDEMFSVEFVLPDYWIYVENGRKPGKMPPISVIEDWIKVKHIIPRPYNGKLPTSKQLAFLIARSIGENGIKPTYALEISLNKAENVILELQNVIKDEIDAQIYEEINKKLEDGIR